MKYDPPATTVKQTLTQRLVLHAVDTTVTFCCPQVEEYVMKNVTFKCQSVQRYQGHYLTCQYSFELFHKTLIKKKKTGYKSIFGDGG